MLHTIIIIEWTQFQATNTIRKLSSPVGKVIDITMATALTKFTKVYNSSWADGFCVSKGNVRVWVLYPRVMKRPSISVFFIACLLILVIEATSQPHESLYRTSGERHANFEKHPHTFLDVSAIAIKRVHDALYCALECLRKARCLSFNMAVVLGTDRKYECQLLATDKYSSSNNLKSTKAFNHHSILVRQIKSCLEFINFTELLGFFFWFLFVSSVLFLRKCLCDPGINIMAFSSNIFDHLLHIS